MAKWHGVVGYADTVEIEPGIWEPGITEREHFGDVIRNTRMLQNSSNINDNVNIGNQISIIADPYALNHIYDMRYVEYMGTNWKVTTVDVQYPRLILSLGGLYTNVK